MPSSRDLAQAVNDASINNLRERLFDNAAAVMVLDTIREEGADGAPAGIIYLALMGHGLTFEQFSKLLAMFKLTGLVRQEATILYTITSWDDRIEQAARHHLEKFGR